MRARIMLRGILWALTGALVSLLLMLIAAMDFVRDCSRKAAGRSTTAR
jgi:hypothetical protein